MSKATITVKQGRTTFTKNIEGMKGEIIRFAHECKKAMRGKVLVHFSDELHPVEILK